MKYEFGKGSTKNYLHILFVPESPEEVLAFKSDDQDFIQAHINAAVNKKMGSDYEATKASANSKYEYQVEIKSTKGIG